MSPKQAEISQAFKSALLFYASTSERVGEHAIYMSGKILVI
jgi:hypothetical protein